MLPRLLLLVACVAASLLLTVRAETAPNTPPSGGDGEDTDPMCKLRSLGFTNGLVLSPAFNVNQYQYTCVGDYSSGSFSTVITPVPIDYGSSAEVKLNGVKIHDRDFNNAISVDGTVRPDSPLTKSNPITFGSGQNVLVIGVACNGYGNPPCYYEYTITCNPPGGSVIGDPQFVGLRGQNYQIHGVAGEIYNIVSDSDLQYNSRFVFLDRGECPVVHGRKQKSCWSHPGSYLGELGLKTKAGDKIHLITGPAKFGFESVTVNDQPVLEGQTVLLAGDLGSVSRNSTHVASVQVGNWDFVFENSDMFVNQRVRVLDSRGLRSHGLLGQTWREATYPNAIKYIEGTVDDYVIRENDIHGDSFVFSAFQN